MPAAQHSEHPKEKERQQRQQVSHRIGEHLMRTLGEPRGLSKVQVRSLWSNYYRVNIITDDGAGSIKIANSFFLEADGEGNIVESTPKITKQY